MPNQSKRWSKILRRVFVVLMILAFILLVLKSWVYKRIAPVRKNTGIVLNTGTRIQHYSFTTNAPELCKRIFENPRPLRKSCIPWNTDVTCNDNRSDTTMFSQFKQDYFLFLNHFIFKKRPGTYVDIATHDAIQISNTFFLDRCLNWRGICVEPLEQYIPGIIRERTCQLIPTCVGSEEGKSVLFNVMRGGSGIIGQTYKFQDKFKKSKNSVVKPLNCTTMRKVLKDNGVNEIDYMSLDVEGHELEVLKGMGLEDIIIRVMTVELSPATSFSINRLLTFHGYRRLILEGKPVYLGEDSVYLHKSVTFGIPA